MSKTPTPTRRIAVYGGDGRVPASLAGEDVRVYPSEKKSGRGSAARLAEAIKHGSLDVLYVLCRWVGHSAVAKLKKLCKKHGVRFEEVRGAGPREPKPE